MARSPYGNTAAVASNATAAVVFLTVCRGTGSDEIDGMAEKSAPEKIRAANGTATANGTPSQLRHFPFFSLTTKATITKNNYPSMLPAILPPSLALFH